MKLKDKILKLEYVEWELIEDLQPDSLKTIYNYESLKEFALPPNQTPIILEPLIDKIKSLAEGKIACANCVYNVNSVCQAIDWQIPIHKENEFFCSDYKSTK